MDFRHPFLSKPRLILYYLIFWGVIGTISILIKWLYYDVPAGAAAVEFFAMPFTFALLGASVWYVIKFSTADNNSLFRLFFYHLIAATIIVLFWLYLGMVLIKLLHPRESFWVENRLPLNVFMGYTMYSMYVIFFYAVNYYEEYTIKRRNEEELKSLVKEAELHALKSQINPHFLFNSLNSIASLTMTDPARAHEMVVNLSSFMRYSLKHSQVDQVTLREEMNNIQLYLQIEKVRFGDKLHPVFQMDDDCLGARLPNMILQPLYENAIKYGVYEATEPVELVTRCTLKGKMLEISIMNNYDPAVLSKKGEGIGLRNIRDRLQLIYNNPLLMKVGDSGEKFEVILAIPQN
jgi:two-component system, LytTR family, sensor kinase